METKYDRICKAIRLACSNRFTPVHGSDIQDWIIGLRCGPEEYWADPADVIADMVRRGLIRRGSKMMRQHQEVAYRAGSWEYDSPFWYWYVAVGLDTTPSTIGKTREQLLDEILSSPD